MSGLWPWLIIHPINPLVCLRMLLSRVQYLAVSNTGMLMCTACNHLHRVF